MVNGWFVNPYELIVALKQYRLNDMLMTMKNTAVGCQAAGGAKSSESVLAGFLPINAGIIWCATNGIF